MTAAVDTTARALPTTAPAAALAEDVAAPGPAFASAGMAVATGAGMTMTPPTCPTCGRPLTTFCGLLGCDPCETAAAERARERSAWLDARVRALVAQLPPAAVERLAAFADPHAAVVVEYDPRAGRVVGVRPNVEGAVEGVKLTLGEQLGDEYDDNGEPLPGAEPAIEKALAEIAAEARS